MNWFPWIPLAGRNGGANGAKIDDRVDMLLEENQRRIESLVKSLAESRRRRESISPDPSSTSSPWCHVVDTTQVREGES